MYISIFKSLYYKQKTEDQVYIVVLKQDSYKVNKSSKL